MDSISPIKLNIADRLERDKAFRQRFFRGQAQDEIAMSIRSLRKKRKKKQSDLAIESGMKQSAVSRVEQSDYSAWSLTTLWRIAEALDARLRIIFEPIEDVVKQYNEKEEATPMQKGYDVSSQDSALEDHIPIGSLLIEKTGTTLHINRNLSFTPTSNGMARNFLQNQS
jgi:transcriptional regulator with XRE-family HTH domain